MVSGTSDYDTMERQDDGGSWEIRRRGRPRDKYVASGVHCHAARDIGAAAGDVGRVEQGGTARIQLANKNVGARGFRDSLECGVCTIGGEVGGSRRTRHIHIKAGIDRDSDARVGAIATEICGESQRRGAAGIELRHKDVGSPPTGRRCRLEYAASGWKIR